ncbi:hypothetical protein B4U80_13599 [Leptotrombidium deliense]|uniref:RING-type domain-containing protein n=1 Tax=Leptotrombidium deliense TaxID=299467 RepID=A0A443SUY1_9ACAR|nr:hypothetical protein B4U80_13599 [Leptotrombidium deliense]
MPSIELPTTCLLCLRETALLITDNASCINHAFHNHCFNKWLIEEASLNAADINKRCPKCEKPFNYFYDLDEYIFKNMYIFANRLNPSKKKY